MSSAGVSPHELFPLPPGPAYTASVQPKTLAHGLSKTRSGKPAISIHKLLERHKLSAFFEALKLSAVSEDEALDAAKVLSEKGHGRAKRYATGGAIGGATYPLMAAVGEAAKGFASKPTTGGRLRAAGSGAVKMLIRPDELAKNVTRGALSGGVVQGIREGVELGHAKKTVKDFMQGD